MTAAAVPQEATAPASTGSGLDLLAQKVDSREQSSTEGYDGRWETIWFAGLQPGQVSPLSWIYHASPCACIPHPVGWATRILNRLLRMVGTSGWGVPTPLYSCTLRCAIRCQASTLRLCTPVYPPAGLGQVHRLPSTAQARGVRGAAHPGRPLPSARLRKGLRSAWWVWASGFRVQGLGRALLGL